MEMKKQSGESEISRWDEGAGLRQVHRGDITWHNSQKSPIKALVELERGQARHLHPLITLNQRARLPCRGPGHT